MTFWLVFTALLALTTGFGLGLHMETPAVAFYRKALAEAHAEILKLRKSL